MKYLFIYFTGTYNTRFLTNKIKENLLSESDSAEILEIKKDAKIVNPKEFDMVGLGFPIYAFNSPKPFNKYLKKLKFNKGQKFFIYKNSGETMAMNNAASRIPRRIMGRKHCVCVGEYHFLMPYNIHFPFKNELIAEMLEKDKKLLEIMKYNLKNGVISEIKSNLLLDAGSFLISVQKIGGGINSFFYKVDTDKCIMCNLCVEKCPEKNISVKNGKITFGHNCDMCMRCSYYCPTKAIKIGMLEKWRVTNYYDLDKIWNGEKPKEPYKLGENDHFYKAYKKSFEMIDEGYNKIKDDLKSE